jgi:hypothetical protein
MNNPFRGRNAKTPETARQEAKKQQQREARLLQLQEEAASRQNRKGLHFPHPLQERKANQEIEALQKEIESYRAKQKIMQRDRKIYIGLGAFLLALFLVIFIMAGKEKGTNTPMNTPTENLLSTRDTQSLERSTTESEACVETTEATEDYVEVLEGLIGKMNYTITCQTYSSATRKAYCLFDFDSGLMTELTMVYKYHGDFKGVEDIHSFRIVGDMESGWELYQYGNLYYMEYKGSGVERYNENHKYLGRYSETTSRQGALENALRKLDPQKAIECLQPKD